MECAAPDVGEALPDVIALARAVLRQDAEAIASIFEEYGFTDAKAGGSSENSAVCSSDSPIACPTTPWMVC